MNYFLTGIKGSGMTALACILKDLGHNVTGSDVDDVFFTDEKLNEKKIEIKVFSKNNITKDIDVLIIGNSFKDDHEEVVKTKELGIKVIRYYDYLQKFADENVSIAIAGTNGKTTTTGLVTATYQDEALISLIGDGTGKAQNKNDYFVFEACEYKNTFWNYAPKFALINNIEMDHPDFFKDLDHVIETYQTFAEKAEVVIINNDDENCRAIKAKSLITFGLETKSDVMFKNISKDQFGFNFDLEIKGEVKGSYQFPFHGDHMIINALAVVAIAYATKKDLAVAIANMGTFTGVKRRFETEVLNQEKNIVMIDDYAHHPTAIELTIEAIHQKYPKAKVSVIFQPHTFTRTVTFLDEISTALQMADNLYLAEIFGSVRESQGDITIQTLIDAVEEKGKEVHRNLDFINPETSNHIIAVLGAGNVDKLYKEKIRDLIGG